MGDTVWPASQCWEALVGLGDKKMLILPRVREGRSRQVLVGKTETFMEDLGCQGQESVASQKRPTLLE